MSVGANPGKADIDSTACGIILSLKSAFEQAADFEAFLLRTGATVLQSQYGNTANEATVLMSAYSDLATLGQIFRGRAAQAGATDYDYLTFGQQLTGLN